MAKLAVFFFAALAIYAAAAHKRPLEFDYDVERYEQFQGHDFETYLMKIQNFATLLTERYHEITTDDHEYVKILTWQSRHLCQYIDTIVEKLEQEDFYHGKDIDRVFLTNFLRELREIQVYLRRADVMNVVELKQQLVRCIYNTVEQIEKFVNWFRMHYTETQGDLSYFVKSVVFDFIKVLQDFDYKFKTVGFTTTTTVGLHQWGMKIEYLTRDLIQNFEHIYLNNVHVKDAFRKFLHHLEVFRTELKEHKHIDVEFITMFEEMYQRLYDVILPIVETTKYDRFVKIDLWKRQFVTELETVCKDILRWVERYETKYQSTEYYYVFEKMLNNYYYTIYNLKTDLVQDLELTEEFHTDFYGKTDLKRELFGLDKYNKDFFYNKDMNTKNFYNMDMYNKNFYNKDMYNKNFYNMDVVRGDYHYNVETTTTYELYAEIKEMIFELTTMFRGIHTLKNQEELHLFQTEFRKFFIIVENMLEQLKQHVHVVKGDVMVLNRIIEQLETSLYSVKHIMEFTTFTGFENFRMQVTKFLHIFVEELEQLVTYHEQYKGTFDIVFKRMLEEVLMTLRTIKYQFRFGYEHNMTYNKDYTYGYDRFDKTHKYGVYDYVMKPYVKDVDRFDVTYGKMDYFNKKFDFGLEEHLYKYNKGELSFDDLVKHINIFCDKLIKNVEIYVNDKQGKEVMVYYVRDLIKMIDTMIYKFEGLVTVEHKEFIYRFIQTLKLVKTDLYEYVHSDVFTSVYQIRTKYIYAIRQVCTELVHFVRDCQYLIRENETIIYDIFYHYFQYLRNACLKLEKIDELEFVQYHSKNVHFDTLRLREFAQDLKYIVEKFESKMYLIKGQDLVIVRPVLLKLRHILREITEEDVTEIKFEYLRNIIQEVTYEIKHWMTVVEQYGFEHDLYVLAKDILFDFTRAYQKLYFQEHISKKYNNQEHLMTLLA